MGEMKKFGEYSVKQYFLDELEKAGWDIYGEPSNNINGAEQLDKEYGRDKEDVIYWDLLKQKILDINDVEENKANDVIEKLKREIGGENLVQANQEFHKKLVNGVAHKTSNEDQSEYVQLIHTPETLDKKEIQKHNSFIAVDEYELRRKHTCRPDITLLVNGIPLTHIELKALTQRSTITNAIQDIKTYENKQPLLFTTTLLNAVSDGERFRTAATGANEEFYFPWRREKETKDEVPEAIQLLFNPKTLLDILEYFTFYEGNTKITPRYMQYRAANKIIDRIRNDKPKKGLIWHTQGSGKSYTMMFTANKLKRHSHIQDKKIFLIVDRKKLEGQMQSTLEDIDFPEKAVAKSKNHLDKLIESNKKQLILTTIHKFGETNVQSDENAVVLIDEAHRYTEGDLESKRRNALPNSTRFGFTGTPVAEGSSQEDRNTFREFSPDGEEYLDRYSIRKGRKDNVITRVTFSLSEIEWEVPEDILDKHYEKEFHNLPLEKRRDILRDYVNQAELSELRTRIEPIIKDIKQHFEEKVEDTGFKALIVTPSRRAAALYCDELRKYRNPSEVDAIISTQGDDPDEMQKYHKSDKKEENIVETFKEADSDLKILVVCDKLLTGFDAPILKTMYLDKELKNHNLLQAIARVNRPAPGKNNGEIVDYQGIFKNPEKALNYSLEYVEDVAQNTEDLVDEYLDLLDQILNMFPDIDWDGTREERHKATGQLMKNDEMASLFLKRFNEAHNLFESVTPHKKLGDNDILTKWQLIHQIKNTFDALRSNEETNRISEDDYGEKTRKILEKHIDVKTGKKQRKEYELTDPELKQVKETQPEFSAAAEGALLEKNIEVKEETNPVYPRLSDRVKEIIEKWKNEDLSDKEAIKEIEKVREKEEEYQTKQEKLGLNDSEFAIYELIQQDYSEYVPSEEIKDIVKKAGEAIENVDIGRRKHTIKQIRKQLISNLTSYPDLLKAKDKLFLREASTYVYENKKEEYNAND